MPKPTADEPRMISARPAARGRNPARREPHRAATMHGGDCHEPSASATTTRRPVGTVTLRSTMAKKKRRKLRARRSKANHGRRPNAGRG